MFEYWIYADNTCFINAVLEGDLHEQIEEDYMKVNGDRIWFFKAKNLIVIQSNVPFGDGNFMLDELLIQIAKSHEIHDKGIIKSHWHASGFH
jgi:hypothetical protein